jgi:drug/metabolite transporter (DMT)-like permease
VFRHQAVSGFKLSFYISVVCSIVMLIVCLLGGLFTVPATAEGWLWTVVLALVVNVGAVVSFQIGTFIIGGERASILSTVEPLTGVVIGAAVFHERVTGFTGVGVALVMAACILIAVTDKKHK